MRRVISDIARPEHDLCAHGQKLLLWRLAYVRSLTCVGVGYGVVKSAGICGGLVVLHLDPTGSGRTERRARSRVRRTAIDCPHQNACRGDESKTRGDLRRPELNRNFRAFQRNLREIQGETSNISSKVVEYKYTKYIY